MSSFRDDIDRFFGSPVAVKEFGGKPSGFLLWRHTAVQLVLNPGLLAVALYRASRWFKLRDMEIPSRIVDRINELLCGIQITGQADFGPGLEIHHPAGIVISPLTRSGKNCVIIGGAVTTGLRDLNSKNPGSQTVELGDNVTIATGAKVLGPIKVGNDVKIGPNVVLMQDVPDGATVIVGSRPKVIEPKIVPADE
jgi:serine O-acetyltransferase